jgi:hypothetical protein
VTAADPYLVHRVDQARAQLADITRIARDHQPGCDDNKLGCAGRDVWTVIRGLGPQVTAMLLFTAVAEMARQPAPTDCPERTPAP